MKIWFDGKSYSVDENETIGTMKTKVLNLPPEMMLIDEKCRLLDDKKSARQAGLADGEAVTSIVKPEYGA
jgi:hypothetical protein